MPDGFEVDKQGLPGGGGANKPASGTYGEKASQAKLAADLPLGDGSSQGSEPFAPMPGSAPTSPPTSTGGRPLNAPPGVPTALLSEGSPGPVGQPLAGPAMGPTFSQSRSEAEARIMWLTMLSENSEVSEESREWARTVLAMLVADAGQ